MIKVTVRNKPISKGRKTLYLDYYPAITHPDTGKPTRREFLKLFIYEKPKTPIEREHNKETENLAKNICAKRQLEVQAGAYGFLSTRQRSTCFIEYFGELADKRKLSSRANWLSALHHLKEYAGNSVKMSDLSLSWCDGFADYLLNAGNRHGIHKILTQNTAVSYFSKLKAALKQAHKDGLLNKDLNAQLDSLTPEETQREVLTYDELIQLANTDCEDSAVKRAALFTALTGIRHSDLIKLLWGQIRQVGAGKYEVHFRQQKTKGVEAMPISDDAYNLLGVPSKPTDKVFPDLKEHASYRNPIIKQWVSNAGITKHITFHCFRHTYATLQLTLGTDIYTVSKMLGHREIKTTQVYAKIVDETKRKAAERIKLTLTQVQK